MPNLAKIYVDDRLYQKLMGEKEPSQAVQAALRRYFDNEVK